MLTDIWTSSMINELSEEDLSSFRDIVLRDVKNQAASNDEKIILQNNLDLWLYSLRVIRREIELQLANHRSKVKLKKKDLRDEGVSQDEIDSYVFTEERWRNNAMKFLTSIERKTLYVKLLIQEEDK